jgi:hypothetical protein
MALTIDQLTKGDVAYRARHAYEIVSVDREQSWVWARAIETDKLHKLPVSGWRML